MFFRKLTGIACVLLICAHSIAQDSDSTNQNKVSLLDSSVQEVERPGLLDWVTNLPEDWKIWSERVTNKEGLLWTGGLTLLTFGLVVTDNETWQETSRWGKQDKSSFIRNAYKQAEFAGQGISQFILAAGFLLDGIVFSDNRALRTASQITEAIVATSAIVQLGKHVTGRESPFKITGRHRTGDWDVFPDQVKYNKNVQAHDAVPSGHIATAQTTATVIIENYPEKKWLPWVAYPLVAWVAFGLVGTDIHWWSDIPYGVAIGYSIGKVVTRNNYPEDKSTSLWKPKYQPFFSDEGVPLLGLRWDL